MAALDEFSTHGFDGVNVVELTKHIGLTTGVLYHHFGSKTGLYNFVREELERRVVDRMEGAFEALREDDIHQAISKATLVGFDAAVKLNACRIFSETPQVGALDLVAGLFTDICDEQRSGLGAIVLACWRAALCSVADGLETATAREALEWIFTKQETKPGVGTNDDF
ncbi:TetR/AcrR family transcriptional regulator [Alicyclobacillus sp. ALC3]|uniref:TetR/AcrR family transcriptional regulator n=1 Tax=Alicyclobacillus sp. ALC3 TaxID=2796143 RepID=UPI0023795AE5|nr:TetR/AcrR family transcriptional regulator [Alicyclobacillus sp. ALC3]WDL96697.1 helix-turn-helix transcriptional regulator [Alicyclobacillus sp. ALC3]